MPQWNASGWGWWEREKATCCKFTSLFFFLLFQTKYALLDEQDIGLVEQYAFEVSTIFSISSLLFPYSTFLCPASHQSVALSPFISEVKSIVHADSQQRSLRSILIDGQYCERSFALLPVLTESSLHHRGVTCTMSRGRRPYNVQAHWKFETGNYLTTWCQLYINKDPYICLYMITWTFYFFRVPCRNNSCLWGTQ